jgi:hypothetical protein
VSYIDDLYWISACVAMRLLDSNPKMARFVSDHGVGYGVALWAAGIRVGIAPRSKRCNALVIPHSSIAMIVSASVVESLGP